MTYYNNAPNLSLSSAYRLGMGGRNSRNFLLLVPYLFGGCEYVAFLRR